MRKKKEVYSPKTEKWVKIKPKSAPKSRCEYYVSSRGRIKSKNIITEDEVLLPGSRNQYQDRTLNLKLKNSKYQGFLIRRLVALAFIGPPKKGQRFVIHRDGNKENCAKSNLKWVTQKQLTEIQFKAGKFDGIYTLNESRVSILKKALLNPKNKIETLARRFKISSNQVRLIKEGKHWGHVKPAK